MLRLCCIRDDRYDAVGRVSISKGRGDVDRRLKSNSGSSPRGDCATGDEERTIEGEGAEGVAFAANGPDPGGDVMLCPMNLALNGEDGSSLVGV